jgi:hypothetical protein
MGLQVSIDDAYDLLTSPLLEEGPFIFHTAPRNETLSSSSSAGRNESVAAVRNESVPMVGGNESSTSSSSSSSSKKRGEDQNEPAGFVDVLLDALLEDDDGEAAAANSIKDLSPKTILKKGGGTGALNMFKKEPIFRNEYGSTSVADENDSASLKKANKGVFWVKLKPVSSTPQSCAFLQLTPSLLKP